MKRIVALLVLLVLFLSMVPAAHAYETPVTSYNKDNHFYVNVQRWATPIYSALEVTDTGYSRLECVGSQLIAEEYDRNFQFVSGKAIELELPIYGGVYLGEDCNILVVGQVNYEENDAVEVFRIIRYSKDWVREGSAGIYGANTTVPFDAGSLRFARSGDILYIRTAHEMYADENGINHQANVMISVRLSDMTVTDQLTKTWNQSYGYVSHSFNQFVLVDGDTLLAVDHGDYYPRSVVLFKYKAAAGQDTFYSRTTAVNALPIVDSSYHYNDTGVSVGGFQASSDHYLIAGCSADQTEVCDLMEAHRNIFVTATPKNNFTDEGTTVHWLTSYEEADHVEVSPPHLVKLSADRFFLIWTENGQIRWCTLDGKGALEGEIRSAEGDLSDCVPVVNNGKVIWYVTEASAPVFYEIDVDGSAHTHNYEAVVTAPTCTEKGYTTHICACGDRYVDSYVDELGHDMGQWETTKEATCTEKGSKQRECSRCDHTETDEIAPLDHGYTAVVTEPTCEAGGYTTYTCSRCGHSYVSDYTDPVDHVYEDGHCKWCGKAEVSEPTAKIISYSTSLGGNIAMNFYVELSDDLVADPDAYIQFGFAGKTVNVPVSEGVLSGTSYRFACPITSKNMTDDITAQVYNADGPVGAPKTMAVDTYCNWIIANTSDQKTINLMKAMLNYGASAQMLFNYRTDDLANAALADADKVFGKVDASAFAHSRVGEEDGIKPVSYTLLLDSETTVRCYFQLTGTKTIDEFTFTVDGIKVEPVYKDGYYYIEKANIAAHRLDDMHVFTCGNITITYGGMSYVNQVMTYYTSGTTFDMASALYAYSKAAEAYIG